MQWLNPCRTANGPGCWTTEPSSTARIHSVEFEYFPRRGESSPPPLSHCCGLWAPHCTVALHCIVHCINNDTSFYEPFKPSTFVFQPAGALINLKVGWMESIGYVSEHWSTCGAKRFQCFFCQLQLVVQVQVQVWVV